MYQAESLGAKILKWHYLEDGVRAPLRWLFGAQVQVLVYQLGVSPQQ